MCVYCDHPERDYLTEEVLPIIARAGWLVQGVSGSGPQAPFAYTVGLTAMGRPELLVTGLEIEAAAMLLNRFAAGPDVEPGDVVEVDGRYVEGVHIPHPEAHLYVADDLYGPDLRAVQLAWQDEHGHSPWCKAHREGRGGQPVLGPRGPRAIT
ncbi:MAG: DUF4262 domain-containing protein [Actinomycetota bacterium]|nr:DUF4262 domain-containing protein [Actinomycetota bacterium]